MYVTSGSSFQKYFICSRKLPPLPTFGWRPEKASRKTVATDAPDATPYFIRVSATMAHKIRRRFEIRSATTQKSPRPDASTTQRSNQTVRLRENLGLPMATPIRCPCSAEPTNLFRTQKVSFSVNFSVHVRFRIWFDRRQIVTFIGSLVGKLTEQKSIFVRSTGWHSV